MTVATRAAIYCRISLAAIGDTTKTDDQERICRELAARLGWEVAEVHTDHSQSAWKANRKRPGWDQMLASIEAGRINAIVVYHGDRLIRQPYDLEILLRLEAGRGVKLASPTGHRDLGHDDDRFILRIEAAMACRESDNTSRRKKMQYERMRRQGLVRTGGGGGRAFGFETDGVTHRGDEAQAIRDAAAAILGGHSAGSVLRDIVEARGLRSSAGNVMSLSAFKRLMCSPRMAGLMPDGEHPAAWLPVIERGEWETLRALLAARPANPRAGRGALYLLSGIAVCGVCGHALYAGYEDSNSYRCPPVARCGKVRRNRAHLDAYVTRRVVNLLNHPGNPAARIPDAPGLGTEFMTLTAARAETEGAITQVAAGRLPVLLSRLDSIDARLAELRELAAGDAGSRLAGMHAGISETKFQELPLAVRRSLVRACFEVTVLPAPVRGGSGFKPELVRLVRLVP